MDVSEDSEGRSTFFPLAAFLLLVPSRKPRYATQTTSYHELARRDRSNEVERPPKGKSDGQSGAVTV